MVGSVFHLLPKHARSYLSLGFGSLKINNHTAQNTLPPEGSKLFYSLPLHLLLFLPALYPFLFPSFYYSSRSFTNKQCSVHRWQLDRKGTSKNSFLRVHQRLENRQQSCRLILSQSDAFLFGIFLWEVSAREPAFNRDTSTSFSQLNSWLKDERRPRWDFKINDSIKKVEFLSK